MRLAGGLRVTSRTPLIQVLKTSAAAIVAWLLTSVLLHQPLPIFAAIAALLVVQPSVSQSLSKGIERSIGVVAGVLIAYLVGYFFGTSSWLVLSVIVLSLVLSWALRLGPGSANQIPISAMLVLAIGSQTPAYAFDRVLETFIGVAIGLVLNTVIVPPVLLGPAHVAVGRLLRECAASLDRLAVSLAEPQDAEALHTLLAQARQLRELRESATAAVAAGQDSLTLNPRRGRHRRILEYDAELLSRLNVLVTRILGMARAVHDRYDDKLRTEPAVRDIARELRRAAHDLRLLGRSIPGEQSPANWAEPGEAAVETPALTAPLTITRPHPTHWVLIGSLLEDIRRVREEIVGGNDG